MRRGPAAPRSARRSRTATVSGEALAFGVVGVTCLVVDLGLYNVLSLGVGLGPLTSKGLSAAAATVLSYALNRVWSFRHRARSGVRRELSLYALLNVTALLGAWLVLGFSYYALRLTSPLAQNVAALAGIGLGTLFRFVTYRRWVFRA